ncbi:MAG TPA: DUF1571 domain-containing protein [Polyangiaceae bacterium]
MEREGVRRLGTYRARVAKQERVHQKLLPTQTFELLVQPWPKALRLEYVEGLGTGRKVIWTEKRPKEILVREGGQRGSTPVWLDVDSSLAHRDTNHNVAEFGFAPILEILARDLVNATQYGGHYRTEEGFDVSGSYCMTLAAPTSAQGLYARRVRLCIDRGLAVPVKIEIYDAAGFLERYTYSDIRADQQLQPGMFEGL